MQGRIIRGMSPTEILGTLRESEGYYLCNNERDVSQSDFKNRLLPMTTQRVAPYREAAGFFSVEVSGGEEARRLLALMDKAGPQARNVAELGVGTNDRARITGTILEDEKILGTVHIAFFDGLLTQKAIDIIKGLTAEAEVGEFYMGLVKRLAEFGAFVEILPGTDGLVHISELDEKRVRQTSDICKEGDEMLVKVIDINHTTNKIHL